MMAMPGNVRVYAAKEPCDFRKQIDGLAGLVRQGLGHNPASGDMFIFRNRRGDMLKILFFDQQGYCLFLKRLDRGTFRLEAEGDSACCSLTAQQLAELLRGVPVRSGRSHVSLDSAA